MTHTVALCCIVLYVTASAFLFAQLWRPSRRGRSTRLSQGALYSAFVLHSATMALVVRDSRMLVLENGADYFLWVSWALALVFLVGRRWFAYPLLGTFIIPSIVLFMGSSSYLLHMSAESLVLTEPRGVREGLAVSLLHGVPALIAVVSLVLALVVSVVFLIVERRLKHRSALALDSGGLSLELLDSLNKHLVQVGFLSITLVIVSGGLWAVLLRKEIFTPDTSVISGLLVWVFLAMIVHARTSLLWSPKRLSRLTVLVTASYFLSVFLVMAVAGRIAHASLWF